jgi:hypothetical protein
VLRDLLKTGLLKPRSFIRACQPTQGKIAAPGGERLSDNLRPLFTGDNVFDDRWARKANRIIPFTEFFGIEFAQIDLALGRLCASLHLRFYLEALQHFSTAGAKWPQDGGNF